MAQPFWAPYKDENGAPLGYEGPLYSDNPWEYVVIGDMKTPGLAKVRAAPAFSVDIQKASGRDASNVILRGYRPGEVEIEVMVWTPDQWERLQEIIQTVWRKPNKTGKLDLPKTGKGASDAAKREEAAAIRAGAKSVQQAALTISHPAVSPFGISHVTVVGFVPIEDGPEAQTKVMRIRCIEYVPPGTDQGTRKVGGSKRQKRDILSAPKVRETIAKASNGPGDPPSKTEGGP